jgi:hypothetical protein
MKWGFFALLPPIQQPRLALSIAVIGALSFWLPDLAVHAVAGCKFDSPHVRIITFLMPATFLFAYVLARRLAAKRQFKWVLAAMLLGVWLTGGLFMTLAATECGGGFSGPDGIRGGLLMIVSSIIPVVTFMMATYDGSLLALLAVTIGAVLIRGIQTGGIHIPFHRRPR